MWVGLPRTCSQMDERYVTEEGIDMTEVFTASCRCLTRADMSVLASMDAATEGYRWEVGLRNPRVLMWPPFLKRIHHILTQDMARIEQHQLRCDGPPCVVTN